MVGEGTGVLRYLRTGCASLDLHSPCWCASRGLDLVNGRLLRVWWRRIFHTTVRSTVSNVVEWCAVRRISEHDHSHHSPPLPQIAVLARRIDHAILHRFPSFRDPIPAHSLFNESPIVRRFRAQPACHASLHIVTNLISSSFAPAAESSVTQPGNIFILTPSRWGLLARSTHPLAGAATSAGSFCEIDLRRNLRWRTRRYLRAWKSLLRSLWLSCSLARRLGVPLCG